MRKILSYLTVLAVVATTITTGVLPAKAEYPACGPVKGGNTTFLVCENRQINHFWSGTKIRVKSVDNNGANLRILNETTGFDTTQYFTNNASFSFVVGTKNNSGDFYNDYISLDITYLGRDAQDPNRVLIEINSNTTYEDSLDLPKVPVYIPKPMLNVTAPFEMNNEQYVKFSWDNPESIYTYVLVVEYSLDGNNYASYHSSYGPSYSDSETVLFNKTQAFGPYYRALVNRFKGQDVVSSDYVYFAIHNAQNNNLPIPTITYPLQNQKIYHDKSNNQNFGFNLPAQTLFTTWDTVADIDNYDVYYEKYDSSSDVWNFYGNFFPIANQDLLSSWIDTGSYRVKIRSVKNNDTSNWSDWTYFEVYNHGNNSTSIWNAGDDGVYIGYKGLAISHGQTYIDVRVLGYDESYVFLELQNAEQNIIYVRRGEFYTVWNLYPIGYSRGLKVYFEDITDQGIKLRLETVYEYAF